MRSLVCALLLACAQLVAAQSYPAKPPRLIAGYSAGGGADALAPEARRWAQIAKDAGIKAE